MGKASMPVPRRVRWLRVLGCGSLLLVVCAGALLCTGFPQRWVIRQALKAAAGGRVEAEIDSTYDVVRLSRVRAYKPAATEPWLDAKGVSLDYSVWPGDGNVIRLLAVERLGLRTDVGGERKPSEQPKPAAAAPATKQKRSPAPRRQKKGINLTPVRITIGSLDLVATRAADLIEIHGLRINVSAPGDGSQTLSLKGDSISGKVAAADMSPREFSGNVDVGVTRDRSGTTIGPLQAHLGGVLDLDGRIALTREDGTTNLFASLPTARCAWDGLVRMALPDAQLVFGVLDASGTTLQLKFNLGQKLLAARGTKVLCAAAPLSLNTPATGISWKSANLRLSGGEASDLDVSGSLAVDEQEKVSITTAGSLLEFTASVKAQEIAWADILAFCPPEWRTALAPIEIESLKSGEASLSFQYPDFKGKATLVPALADSAPAARIECEGEGSLVGALLGEKVNIRASAAVAEQDVHAEGYWTRGHPSKFSVALDRIDPRVWLCALNPSTNYCLGTGCLSGSVQVEGDSAGPSFTAKVHLDQTTVDVTAMRLEGLTFDGSVQGGSGPLRGEGEFEAQDLSLPGVGTNALTGKASIEGSLLRLHTLASREEAGGLTGNVDLDLSSFPAQTSLTARLDKASLVRLLPSEFGASVPSPSGQGDLQACAQGPTLTKVAFHMQSLAPVELRSVRVCQLDQQASGAASTPSTTSAGETLVGLLSVDASYEAGYLVGKASLACASEPREWPIKISVYEQLEHSAPEQSPIAPAPAS